MLAYISSEVLILAYSVFLGTVSSIKVFLVGGDWWVGGGVVGKIMDNCTLLLLWLSIPFVT